MNEKLRIAEYIKKLINDFDKYMDCFPRKEIELKNNLYNTAYELLKCVYEANCTFDEIKRVNLQDKIIAYIKFLDFCINRCYDHKIINNKRYIKFGENLGHILILTVKWREVSIKK